MNELLAYEPTNTSFVQSMRVNLPVSFGFTGDFAVGVSASSSLDEDDMSLGIFMFKNDHKVLKLKVFLNTHGYNGHTCDNTEWTVTFNYFTSVLVLVVVPNPGTASRFAFTNIRKENSNTHNATWKVT